MAIVVCGAHVGAQRKSEIDTLKQLALMRPTIKAEAGFAADLLVPTGNLYDPLNIRPRAGGGALIDDDGAQDGQRGGRIWAVDAKGNVSTFVESRRLLPVLGFDIAPPGFGTFAGQLFLLTQPRVTLAGAFENHVIQYLDPNGREVAKRFCTLPPHGVSLVGRGEGAASAGSAARFGPRGTPFGDRFFAVTPGNGTIYQVTADGVCKPFVTPPDATPRQLTFSADGSKMLVAARRRRAPGTGRGGAPPDGVILTVGPDGSIDPRPIATFPGEGVGGVAVAPPTFGPYGGQLFVTTWLGTYPGSFEGSASELSKRPATGKVYRVTPGSQAQLVATGFYSPQDLAFIDDSIWVVDLNADYLGGGFYLPDGFVVRIRRK